VSEHIHTAAVEFVKGLRDLGVAEDAAWGAAWGAARDTARAAAWTAAWATDREMPWSADDDGDC